MTRSIVFLFLSSAILFLSTWVLPLEVYSQRQILKKNIREDPERSFKEAVVQYKKNKPNEAEQILQKVIRQYPQFTPAWALLAMIHYERQDYREAKNVIYHALKKNPGSQRLNKMAAKILFKENKSLKAIEFINRAKHSTDADENEMDSGTTDMEEIERQIVSVFSQQTKSKPVYYAPTAIQKSDWQAELPSVPQDKKLSIAVFIFQTKPVTTNIDSTASQIGSTLCDMLTTSMVQTNCFRVVERQQLDKVMAEQDFEMGESIDQSTAVRVGELFGVDAVLVGACTQLDSQTEIDGRMVNIQSGQIISAANVNYRSTDQLRTAVQSLTVLLTQSAYK